MDHQLNLLGEANKVEGQNRAWDAANTDWRTAALSIVRELAVSRATLTTDEVWRELDSAGFRTREHRAMGAVMRAAAQRGWIRRTDFTTPTTRPCANRRPVAVWQSKLKGQR